MKKYLRIAKITWIEATTYRLNFIMWRLRIMFHVLTLYFLWLAVLPNHMDEFSGYTQASLLSYVLIITIVSAFVTPTRSYAIGDDIVSGNLSNFLIRPINYFLYWAAKDAGDRIMDILFSIGELTILFLLLRPPLFMQADIMYILLTAIAMLFSLLLYFSFNLLLGFIGFWSSDIWAPRFVFYTVISFLAGGYFPLDILPKSLFAAFQFLPFGYLLYFPVKIYLGELSIGAILSGLSVSFFWVICFFFIVFLLWRRGLRMYTAQGR